MPRGPCHFALLSSLHRAMRSSLPEAAALADSHLSDFVGGSVAPDGLRYVGRMGKYPTHFYEESKPETWGKAVSGMFAAHPELADPGAWGDEDVVLVMGYISHLTVDEAFRDTVTHQVHGMPVWRPLVRGLWSLVDELPVHYDGVRGYLDTFAGEGAAGFIDRAMVRDYGLLIRAWADHEDPWDIERVFLQLTRSQATEEDARTEWLKDREDAAALLGPERLKAFETEAVGRGVDEIRAYLQGRYAR